MDGAENKLINKRLIKYVPTTDTKLIKFAVQKNHKLSSSMENLLKYYL